MQNKLSVIIMLTVSLFLVGCGQDIVFDNTPDSNTSDSNATGSQNKAPTAIAGKDRNATIFKAIEIVGGGTDSDGQIVDYEWKEGAVLISGIKKLTYVPSSDGNHTLTLIVYDDDGATGKDSLIVTVAAVK